MSEPQRYFLLAHGDPPTFYVGLTGEPASIRWIMPLYPLYTLEEAEALRSRLHRFFGLPLTDMTIFELTPLSGGSDI